MSLSSPPVDGMNLEGSTLALLNEFLTLFFDGATHTVGDLPNVLFPQAVLRFQEAPLPQPLGQALGISIAWVSLGRITKSWDYLSSTEQAAFPGVSPRQQRVQAHCAWSFFIRASQEGSSDNSQKQVQSGASKLFGLLQNSTATLPLAEKGIQKLKPAPPRMAFQGDGGPSPDLGFRLRVLTCAGLLRYPLISQPNSI